MNAVLDEAPARVEDVEMFDDYAAQGVMDEIPEVEARMMIPRKKRSETKRRRRELAAPGKRRRKPNVRNFDQ
jgi:hypothetical protein